MLTTKWWLSLALLVATSGAASALSASACLIGHWQFSAIFWDGREYPLPNPDLNMTFAFGKDDVASLSWSRADEDGFCERKAHYQTDAKRLYQKVFWLNPANRDDCSTDPDMRMEAESWNTFSCDEENLKIDFPLDDKVMTLIFRRLDY